MWEEISKEFLLRPVSWVLKRVIDALNILKTPRQAVCHCCFASAAVLDPAVPSPHADALLYFNFLI